MIIVSQIQFNGLAKISHVHATLLLAVSVGPSVGRSVRLCVRPSHKFRPNFAVLLLPNRPRLDCRVSGLVLVNCYSQQGNYPALRVVSLLVFFYWLFGYTIFVFGYTIIVFIMGSGAEIQFLYFFFLLAACSFFIQLLYKLWNTIIKYRRLFLYNNWISSFFYTIFVFSYTIAIQSSYISCICCTTAVQFGLQFVVLSKIQ